MTIPATFNETYRIRTRATGANGAVGPWTNLPPLTAVFIPATSSQITYQGQWKTTASGRATSAANGAATLSFNGQNVAWITTTGPTYGRATFTADGENKSTDLYSSTATTLQAIVKKGWYPAPSAAHVIRVQNDGKGSINVTGFVILR